MKNIDLSNSEGPATGLDELYSNPILKDNKDEPELEISAEEFMLEVERLNIFNSKPGWVVEKERNLLMRAGYKYIEGVSVKLASNQAVHEHVTGQYALAQIGCWDY